MRWQEGCNHNKIKSHNPIPLGWWLTNWRKITSQNSTHWSKGSESHVRLPNLGVQQREEEFPENQALKFSEVWLQDFNRSGGNRDSTLEGTHKVVCASGPSGKEQWPHKRLNQNYWLMLEGLMQRQGAAVAHHGDKDTGSRSSGKYSLVWALSKSTISSTKEL